MPERSLLDFGPIHILASDVGPALALEFLDGYLAMLPGRLQRILAGLRDEDAEKAMDAILSLKISSAMNGALKVEASCATLAVLVRQGCFERARPEAVQLYVLVAVLMINAPVLLYQAARIMGPFSTDACDGPWTA
jgi:hypothetical protein